MTSAASLRTRLVSDAVVSAYIHEISTPAGARVAAEPDARAERLTRRVHRRRRDLGEGADRLGRTGRRAGVAHSRC